MFQRTLLTGCAAVAMALGLGAFAMAEDAKPAPTTQPYPLSVCVVSDEALGSMGDTYIIQYEGREVRLCCDHCEADFKKDPQKYLKKLDEAAKKAPATQPAKKDSAKEGASKDAGAHDHAAHDHGTHQH